MRGPVVSEPDSDCFYVPASADTAGAAALLVLSCTGATSLDIDSLAPVADSLGLILAGCHGSRNHRTVLDNDRDILATYARLAAGYCVDPGRIYICGFSGMGAQSIRELVTHPSLFRGALSACSPLVGLTGPELEPMTDNACYLISRETDWNLQANRLMYEMLQDIGIPSKLEVLPGGHAPGPNEELLRGMTWLLGIAQ
jgi:hypothetical protein